MEVSMGFQVMKDPISNAEGVACVQLLLDDATKSGCTVDGGNCVTPELQRSLTICMRAVARSEVQPRLHPTGPASNAGPGGRVLPGSVSTHRPARLVAFPHARAAAESGHFWVGCRELFRTCFRLILLRLGCASMRLPFQRPAAGGALVVRSSRP